jgi:hypothetical protein
VVTASGALQADDGASYWTPSRAASEVGSVGAIDGWRAWVVDRLGKSLDAVRAEFLDAIDAESRDGNDPAEETNAPSAHDCLRQSRTEADIGQPRELTVLELLGWWGEKTRTPEVTQTIDAELANHGLRTSPNFSAVTLETKVQLILRGQPEESQRASAIEPTDDPDEEDDYSAPSSTLGNLPSALAGVVSVPPDATVDLAVTKMMLDDYSQLAVMSTPRSVRGAVSWKSIARARHQNSQATLADAIIQVQSRRYDVEIIEVIPVLLDEDFVLVTDETGLVTGIVTVADVVTAYGEMSTPFMMIGELDRALRRLLRHHFSIDEVAAVCGGESGARKVRSFDQLTMGDYRSVLSNPAMWGRLGWPLERKTVIARLEQVGAIRNNVMHFNPDPIPHQATAQIRHLTALIQKFAN